VLGCTNTYTDERREATNLPIEESSDPDFVLVHRLCYLLERHAFGSFPTVTSRMHIAIMSFLSFDNGKRRQFHGDTPEYAFHSEKRAEWVSWIPHFVSVAAIDRLNGVYKNNSNACGYTDPV
jgi:hypothetical protein